MTRQDLFDAIAQVSDLPDTQALDAIVEFVAKWLATDAAKNVMNGMDDDIIWMVADYWRERMA